MQPLEQLVVALDAFEKCASQADKKAAVACLRRLSRMLEVQTTELLQQRLLLMQAECARDRETLRDLAEFSLFPEIVSWVSDILHPKPRTPGGLEL
jgi:hypothetical protein